MNEFSNRVTVVDIQMPFWSIVAFMVKAAIASIPAIIILSILLAIVMAIFTAMFGGMGMM